MSTLKADAVTTKSDNTDLVITGGGSGVPDIEASFKVGGTAGVPMASIRTTSGTASSSTFLRGDGTWNAAGGGLTLISETSITAVANIDMTGFDDSKYSGYKLMIENMRPASDAYLYLRTSADGGSSFNTSSGYPSGYAYSGKSFHQGSAENDVSDNTSGTFFRMSVLLLRSDGHGVFNGTWDILGTPSAGRTSICGVTTIAPSVGGVHTQIIGGRLEALTLTNAIQLAMSSGNFQAQGVVRLFGYTTTV